MQYVLLTVTNNKEDIIAYDSVITAYQVYKDSKIRYNNTTIEVRIFDSSLRDEFFQTIQYLTCKPDVKLLEVLDKEGLLK